MGNRISPLSLLMIGFFVTGCDMQKTEKPNPQPKEAMYAIAVLPTPVLNTPDFSFIFGGSDGKTLKLNKKNMIEEVEFIAMPQTVFSIEETIKKDNHEILKVKTEDYPYPTKKGYYIDSRFVERKTEKPQERRKQLPDRDTIINKLRSAKGSVYVWGGNYAGGIPEMIEFYKPSGQLSRAVQDRWILKGVDCSGLLYEAAGGYTPRNTESLFNFGAPVDIEGLKPDEIAKKLKPLDMVVYKRHVLIVLNNKEVIESTVSEGVYTKGVADALRYISKKMTPVNDYEKENGGDKFVVRRWHQQ